MMLFNEKELKERLIKFMAVYFNFGSPYNLDDLKNDPSIPKEWIGMDSVFEDSLGLRARSEKELVDKIEEVWNEGADCDVDLEENLPEIICDARGNLAIDMMKLAYGKDYDPEKDRYSHGRENILQFWEREKWKFV